MFILKRLLGGQDDEAILKEHFEYQNVIQANYKKRRNSKNLEIAVEACYKQIRLAPKALRAFRRSSYIKKIPLHVGYQQLCIIRAKQGQHDEVIKLACKAKKQGWNGSWDSRIKKAKKALKK